MKGFDNLELFFKLNFIVANTTYLVSTRYYQYTAELFSWQGFFFEQYYDNTQHKITMVNSASGRDLNKYLKDISLEDLGVYTTL